MACEARTMDHLTDQPNVKQSTDIEQKRTITAANAPEGSRYSQGSKAFIQIRHNGWRAKVTGQPQSDSANAGPSLTKIHNDSEVAEAFN